MNKLIYAGTFNPIHTGHLIIAEHVREELKADKVIFIPSYKPPHRENDVAPAIHRLNMVKLAINNNKYFELSDIEFKSEEKSYTYNTILNLKKNNPDYSQKYKFIIGTDAFNLVNSWYKAEELKSLLEFIVIERPNNSQKIETVNVKEFPYTIIKAPYIEISSTTIRKRLKAKKSIKYLVTNEVEDYILKNELYS